MRIESKKSIFLNAIETGIYPIGGYWSKVDFNPLRTLWGEMSSVLRRNVFYITSTYYEAMVKSIKSFNDVLSDTELMEEVLSKYQRLFILSTKGYGAYLIYFIGENCSFIGVVTDVGPVSYTMTIGDKKYEYGKEDDLCYSSDYIIFPLLLMEEYAKVETNIVQPKCKKKIVKNQLDVLDNETRMNVYIRDCTWFTTIIRNEDFNVSGHFRLQPIKVDGKDSRKLIYIQPFVKHGYHRQASILNK